jgi:hypothetical protein
MHVVQKAGRIGSNTIQTQWSACGAEVAVQTERALDALYSFPDIIWNSTFG